jgi:hypothetical protein
MRSSKETYQEVAKACSEYSPYHKQAGFYNDCTGCDPSCLNCSHFTKEEYCNLDLYDKIVNRIHG